MKNKLRLVGALLGAVTAGVVYHEGTGIGADGLAHAYLDGAGVWTICSGDTYNVERGQVETKQQCQQRLSKSLQEHAAVLDGLPQGTPDYAVLSIVDFAYHVGVSAARHSSVWTELHSGNVEAAAQNIGKYRFITNDSKRGKPGWRLMSGHYRYDCSTVGNSVCAGIWKRRLWQMDTMSGKLGDATSAEKALPRYDRMYAQDGRWVVPAK